MIHIYSHILNYHSHNILELYINTVLEGISQELYHVHQTQNFVGRGKICLINTYVLHSIGAT